MASSRKGSAPSPWGLPVIVRGPLLVLLSACVTVHVETPLASYREAVAQASAAVGAYFSDVNAFERDLYFDELRTDPRKEVLATGADGRRTPLLGETLSAESIRARLDS